MVRDIVCMSRDVEWFGSPSREIGLSQLRVSRRRGGWGVDRGERHRGARDKCTRGG